jgi:phosphatidylglycerol:prolipoprotein diacylglycerol transferase
MWPHELIIGPVAVNGYGLMVAAGVAAGIFFLKLTAPPAGAHPDQAMSLALVLVIAGLVGSRLAYVAAHLPTFIDRPASALMYWRGGLMFQGGLAGGFLLALILAARGRISLPVMGDAFAPALALGQGLGRLGCLLAGCCYGRVASPRWLGLTFPQGSNAPWGVPLYPTQAIESIALLILAALLFRGLKRRPSLAAIPLEIRPEGALEARPGQIRPDAARYPSSPPPRPSGRPGRIFAHYLLWVGLIRLAMEFLRGDDRGPRLLFGARPTALVALMIVAAGAFSLFWPRRAGRPAVPMA